MVTFFHHQGEDRNPFHKLIICEKIGFESRSLKVAGLMPIPNLADQCGREFGL
jgi:hypothetical protein